MGKGNFCYFSPPECSSRHSVQGTLVEANCGILMSRNLGFALTAKDQKTMSETCPIERIQFDFTWNCVVDGQHPKPYAIEKRKNFDNYGPVFDRLSVTMSAPLRQGNLDEFISRCNLFEGCTWTPMHFSTGQINLMSMSLAHRVFDRACLVINDKIGTSECRSSNLRMFDMNLKVPKTFKSYWARAIKYQGVVTSHMVRI